MFRGMAVTLRKKQPAKSGKPRKRKGVRPKPTALLEQLEKDEGQLLAAYREPLGGHKRFLVALPIELVEPTPFLFPQLLH